MPLNFTIIFCKRFIETNFIDLNVLRMFSFIFTKHIFIPGHGSVADAGVSLPFRGFDPTSASSEIAANISIIPHQ